MHENKFKNITPNSSTDLDNFIQLLADLNEEIELFALGGTAMVLKSIKEATKDIDFITTTNYKTIKRLFTIAGLKEQEPSQLCNIWYLGNIRIDIFYHEFILGYPLPPDWKKLSEHIKTIGKIKIFILNWFDLIITKIARSEKRDIEDIIAIIKSQKIDFQKLKKRYYQYAETALITDYDIKFKHLEHKLSK